MIATMFSFGAMSVSAAITASVDYSKGEVATIGASSLDAAPVYYALKYNNERPERARWMPMQGTTLDISKYIPKANATTEYIIGFILKADLEAGNVDATELKLAPRATDIARTAVTWDPATGELKGATTDMEYRMEGCGWLDAATDLKISAARIPTGTTVYLRTKATTTTPASREIKVKIAAQPKAPAGFPVPPVIAMNARVAGLRNGMEVSKDNAFATATTVTLTADDLTYGGLFAALAAKSGMGVAAVATQGQKPWKLASDVTLFVRVPSSGNKPASAVSNFTIPSGDYGTPNE